MNNNDDDINNKIQITHDWTTIGSSYKKPSPSLALPPSTTTTQQQNNDKNDSSQTESDSDDNRSSKKKKKNKRKHKSSKKRRKKRHHDSDEYNRKKKRKTSHEDELQKIYEFEKKRIKVDPRSNTSFKHTLSRTLWNNSLEKDLSSESDDKIFQYDYKGDPNNLLFGSIYREDIPSYRIYKGKNPYTNETIKWKIGGFGEVEKVTIPRYWKSQSRQKQHIQGFRYEDNEWKQTLEESFIPIEGLYI
jgi:DNA mismatch repair ATPase MutL